MNNVDIENIVRTIIKDMAAGGAAPVACSCEATSSGLSASVKDYPIAQKHPEWIRSESGKTLDDITLENVMAGKIQANDLRISPRILKAQGDIAASAGRPTITKNFSRAAELTAVPDERVLAIYNALRPYRSSKEELLNIADELESKYKAVITANFVREAAGHYEKRKKLKGDN